MILSYNLKHVGDTLMIDLVPEISKGEVRVERTDDIAKIIDDNREYGINLFNASTYLGEIKLPLNAEQIEKLSALLPGYDFVEASRPKIVVGLVKECIDHPDSDHLHVCQVDVADAELLQIVCGAANVAEGERVVVAEVGAMMPDGSYINDGKLRGVASHGMLCSARELHLPDAPDVPGILLLDDSYVVGSPFGG
ncbi:MAG: DUF4479 and tRNA-binding domain-containing protein [Lactobacillales bacterium]|jgi:tRNA-binding protein|nr:DUF4479 and tRNA-binding domain-containing protein [Lactobacillales bacterium]